MLILKIMMKLWQKSSGTEKFNPCFSVLEKSFLIIVFGLGFTIANAQDVWNLTSCINYGVEHNFDLNRKALEIDSDRINILGSVTALLPDLNAGSSASLSFGRNVDENYNITYDRNLSNSYWIESSIDVFKGLVNVNTIFYNRYLQIANKEAYETAKNKIILDIISAYYSVSYTKGLFEVAKKQVEVSESQIVRSQRMVDLGKESPVLVQELKSQWAADKLNLAQVEGSYINSLTNLKLLIRLTNSSDFKIENIDSERVTIELTPEKDSIFLLALKNLPEIKQQKNLLLAAEKNIAVAKGQLSPRIYFGAGLNTNYYKADGSGDVVNFRDQFNNNQGQYIQAGISIPLFNRMEAYCTIKKKQLAVKEQAMISEHLKEEIETQIIKAVQDFYIAENEMKSANELLTYSEVNLKQTEKKLDNGLADATDYAIVRQRYTLAQASLLKAKLIYLLQYQMLQYYQNGNWDFLGR